MTSIVLSHKKTTNNMKHLALIITLTFGLAGNVYAQSWSDITPDSRQVLRPLRTTWEELPPPQRQQWLARTSQLKQMSAEQLSTAQERMAEWASLSQKQRQQVQRQLNSDNSNANARAKSWNSFIGQ